MIDLSTVTDYYQCYWKRLKSFSRKSTLTGCCLPGIKGAVSRMQLLNAAFLIYKTLKMHSETKAFAEPSTISSPDLFCCHQEGQPSTSFKTKRE